MFLWERVGRAEFVVTTPCCPEGPGNKFVRAVCVRFEGHYLAAFHIFAVVNFPVVYLVE